MADVFLFGWNPDSSGPSEDEIEDIGQIVEESGPVEGAWSIGSRRHGIGDGSRGYLVRQGSRRGLVASVRVTGGPYEDEHWADAGKTAWYVPIEFVQVLNELDRVPTELLLSLVPEVPWNHLQGSGVMVTESAVSKLDNLWSEHIASPVTLGSSEGAHVNDFLEGHARPILVNRYERDPAARRACLAHWGTTCTACLVDLGKTYGEVASGYVHVHHLVPLSQVAKAHKVDPVADMRPLCPNCHSVIHITNPPMTLEALQAIVQNLKGTVD